MKSLRFLLPGLVAAAIFAPMNGHAVAIVPQSFTYHFTADPSTDPGDTGYDGSFISINNGSISDWDLFNSNAQVTPSSSSVIAQTILSYNASSWMGTFAIGIVLDVGEGQAFVGFLGTAAGGVPDRGSLDFASTGVPGFVQDPPGVWSGASRTVPDFGSSFLLLGAACVGLLALRYSVCKS